MCGGGWSRPVNVPPRGADWITRSLAKRSAFGGTIDRPEGGGLFLLVGGPLWNGFGFSTALADSGTPSPFADFNSLCSIIDRC